MKNPTWQEYVKNSIQTYPSLYAGKNFTESELMVADHTFLCNGNGLNWGSLESPEGPFVLGQFYFNGNYDDDGERECDFISLSRNERKKNNFPYNKFIENPWWEKLVRKEKYGSYCFEGYFFEKPELVEEGRIIDTSRREKITFPRKQRRLPPELSYQQELDKKKEIDEIIRKIREDDNEEELREKSKKFFKPEVNYHYHDPSKKVYSPSYLSCYDRGTMALQCPAEKMEPSWRQVAIKVCLVAKHKFQQQPIENFCSHLRPRDYIERWEGLSIEKVQKDWNMPIWNGNNIEECIKFQKVREKKSYDKYLNKVLKHLGVNLKDL